MSLPTPPRYVVLPVDVIEQAFVPDKPPRVLLASYVRILSLAWEAKYQNTPPLPEEELIEFLKLSRRQYFDQKSDMELLGWLRSSHPRPGFVQFSFSRPVNEKATPSTGAENRTTSAEPPLVEDESLSLDPNPDSPPPLIVPASAENRTADAENPLVGGEESFDQTLNSGIDSPPTVPSSAENRTDGAEDPLIGGEESLDKTLISVSDSPPPTTPASAENRTFPGTSEILLHTDLLFDGAIVAGRDLADRDPLAALAWCAYAYANRHKLNAPAGLVRSRLKDNECPPQWFKEQWKDRLPDGFLEVLGLVEYTCEECGATFPTRSRFEAHEPTHSDALDCTPAECKSDDGIEQPAETEEPYMLPLDESVSLPIGSGSLTPTQAWQCVLGQLQMQMPRASFDTWVSDTRACRYRENTLSVSVPNLDAQEWLESRVAMTASRLLVGVLNTSVAVEFVVMQEGAYA